MIRAMETIVPSENRRRQHTKMVGFKKMCIIAKKNEVMRKFVFCIVMLSAVAANATSPLLRGLYMAQTHALPLIDHKNQISMDVNFGVIGRPLYVGGGLNLRLF